MAKKPGNWADTPYGTIWDDIPNVDEQDEINRLKIEELKTKPIIVGKRRIDNEGEVYYLKHSDKKIEHCVWTVDIDLAEILDYDIAYGLITQPSRSPLFNYAMLTAPQKAVIVGM